MIFADFREFREHRDDYYEWLAHGRVQQLVRREAQEAAKLLSRAWGAGMEVPPPVRVKDVAGKYYDYVRETHGDVDKYRKEQAAKFPGYDQEKARERLTKAIVRSE